MSTNMLYKKNLGISYIEKLYMLDFLNYLKNWNHFHYRGTLFIDLICQVYKYV